LALEKQNGSWQASSPSLLSGVYDLQTDRGAKRNALVLADELEDIEESGSPLDNNLWIIEDSVLESTPSTALSEQCSFQIRQGKLIGFLPPESEQTPEPSTEPDAEPSEGFLDDALNEDDTSGVNAGCQSTPLIEKSPFLPMILLSMIFMIRGKNGRLPLT
jgi:hypothetical protein